MSSLTATQKSAVDVVIGTFSGEQAIQVFRVLYAPTVTQAKYRAKLYKDMYGMESYNTIMRGVISEMKKIENN